LLLYPLASELANIRRLLVVPEPALQYVPFGALPMRNGLMLAASHEIAYLPSASVCLRWSATLRRVSPRARALWCSQTPFSIAMTTGSDKPQ
jgi:hypothetical protein